MPGVDPFRAATEATVANAQPEVVVNFLTHLADGAGETNNPPRGRADRARGRALSGRSSPGGRECCVAELITAGPPGIHVVA